MRYWIEIDFVSDFWLHAIGTAARRRSYPRGVPWRVAQPRRIVMFTRLQYRRAKQGEFHREFNFIRIESITKVDIWMNPRKYTYIITSFKSFWYLSTASSHLNQCYVFLHSEITFRMELEEEWHRENLTQNTNLKSQLFIDDMCVGWSVSCASRCEEWPRWDSSMSSSRGMSSWCQKSRRCSSRDHCTRPRPHSHRWGLHIENKRSNRHITSRVTQSNLFFPHFLGELLARLKNDTLRQEYVEQMKMNGQQLPRIKVKLLGPSGVGKSTLLDSLKCGYFSSWFRTRSSPPTKTNSGNQQVRIRLRE